MNTTFNLTYLEKGVDRGEARVAPANPTPHLQNSRGWGASHLQTREWCTANADAIGVPTRGRG